MKFHNAFLLSLIFHIVFVGLFVLSYQFSVIEPELSSPPVPKIHAKTVSNERVEQLVKKIRQEQLAKKNDERKRLERLKKAEQAAKRKRKEQEQKAREARKRRELEERKLAALKKKRIKEENARKKKIAEEKKRRLKKEAEEKKRKARKEAERRAAEEKARQEAMEREMQAQMEVEAAELSAARHRQVLGEVSKYSTLIRGKVQRNWIEPERPGYCVFKVRLSQGGLVIGVTVVEGGRQHCESGQRAIYKSEPLPVPKDPAVFAELKSINFTLKSKDFDARR